MLAIVKCKRYGGYCEIYNIWWLLGSVKYMVISAKYEMNGGHCEVLNK